MEYIRHIIIVLFVATGLFADSFGYLRQVEVSICMDDCSQYSLESEDGDFITFLANINNFDLSYFINRYVEIENGGEYQCIECNAMVIQNISLFFYYLYK